MPTSEQVLDLFGVQVAVERPPRMSIRRMYEEPDDEGEFAAERALASVAKHQPAADQQVVQGLYNDDANWYVRCSASSLREKGTTGAMISIIMLGGETPPPASTDPFHRDAWLAAAHVQRANRCREIFRRMAPFDQAAIVACYGPLPGGYDFGEVRAHLEGLAGLAILTEHSAGNFGDLMAHCHSLSSPRPDETTSGKLWKQHFASWNGSKKSARDALRLIRERARSAARHAHSEWESISKTIPHVDRQPQTFPVEELADMLREATA